MSKINRVKKIIFGGNLYKSDKDKKVKATKINFVIGTNGSGKTTLLNYIDAWIKREYSKHSHDFKLRLTDHDNPPIVLNLGDHNIDWGDGCEHITNKQIYDADLECSKTFPNLNISNTLREFCYKLYILRTCTHADVLIWDTPEVGFDCDLVKFLMPIIECVNPEIQMFITTNNKDLYHDYVDCRNESKKYNKATFIRASDFRSDK